MGGGNENLKTGRVLRGRKKEGGWKTWVPRQRPKDTKNRPGRYQKLNKEKKKRNRNKTEIAKKTHALGPTKNWEEAHGKSKGMWESLDTRCTGRKELKDQGGSQKKESGGERGSGCQNKPKDPMCIPKKDFVKGGGGDTGGKLTEKWKSGGENKKRIKMGGARKKKRKLLVQKGRPQKKLDRMGQKWAGKKAVNLRREQKTQIRFTQETTDPEHAERGIGKVRGHEREKEKEGEERRGGGGVVEG